MKHLKKPNICFHANLYILSIMLWAKIYTCVSPKRKMRKMELLILFALSVSFLLLSVFIATLIVFHYR